MIYLDYAASNPFTKYPCSKYGQFLNPNANYAYKEQKLLDECANRVKAAIGAKSGKVVFGGTSSQLIENLMNASKQNTVICSKYEHDSFWRYRFDSVDEIDDIPNFIGNMPESYGKMLVMWQGVNNITGEIFPVEQIGSICHGFNSFYICGFGCHLEKEPNRFQALAKTHPQLYDYCMRGGKYDESTDMWIPDKGLGMAKVLDYINVKWWNDGDEVKRDEYRAKYKEKEKIEQSRKKSSQTN